MSHVQSPILRSFLLHATILVVASFAFSTPHPVPEIELNLTSVMQDRKTQVIPRSQPKRIITKTIDDAPAGVGAPLVDNETQTKGESEQIEAADVKGVYLSELRTWIDQQKFYPESARSLGQTGVVEVKFRIDPSGNIINSTLEKQCAYARLNQAAISLMKSLGRFKPAPAGVFAGVVELILPIEYRL